MRSDTINWGINWDHDQLQLLNRDMVVINFFLLDIVSTCHKTGSDCDWTLISDGGCQSCPSRHAPGG